MLWCSDCERAWKWIFTLRGVSLLKSILIFTLWSALSTFGEKLDYTRPLKIVIWKYIFEKPSTSWSLHCSAQCSVKPEYNSILCFKQCLIKIHPLHIAQLHIAQLHIAASLCTQYLITVASQCTGLRLWYSSRSLADSPSFGCRPGDHWGHSHKWSSWSPSTPKSGIFGESCFKIRYIQEWVKLVFQELFVDTKFKICILLTRTSQPPSKYIRVNRKQIWKYSIVIACLK